MGVLQKLFARNVIGDTSGTDATASMIGEIKYAANTGTTGALTVSGTFVDVSNSSIVLTPGNWEVRYLITAYVAGTSAQNTGFYVAIDGGLDIDSGTALTPFGTDILLIPADVARTAGIAHRVTTMLMAPVTVQPSTTRTVKAKFAILTGGFTAISGNVTTVTKPYAVRIA